MLTLRARWVLPVAGPPLDEGWVAVEDGRIAAVGHERRSGSGDGAAADVDLGRSVLLPGLVNAHTHLELSYLAGAVPPAARFTDWIRQVMALRREQRDPGAAAILEPMRADIARLRRLGTALVGDVSNTLVSVPALADAAQPAAVFFEQVRFRSAGAETVVAAATERVAALPASGEVRVSLAPHAPYSVSPRLFQSIRRELDRDPFARTSVHLAESTEEMELLERGSGPWRSLLEELGAWDESWVPPRCGPVEYLDRMRVLDERVLVVHGVQLSRADLERLVARRTTLVTCPRSNAHVGVGSPPIEAFYRSGVAVAIGTDSRASAPDLSVWNELAEVRRHASEVPAARLIESATRIGAECLGFGAELGTIEPGKRAALVAVSVPPGVETAVAVEEYLVGGIDPDTVRWAGDID
jgi:cytosine/adenosine deaminase-related metal-dependent hydrolase